MTAATLEAIQQDNLAMSVAHALSAANRAAQQHGVDVAASLVTIVEQTSTAGRQWRIHYGPRDYISRRGGDLSIVVDGQTTEIRQVLRGQ
jgi:hypothetical protein